MTKDLNKILIEWAYRTSDGKPDVKNNSKLILLEGVLSDFGWSREARAELLGTLMEAPEQKDDNIDPDTIVKYKDEDGEDKEAKYSYASRAKEGTPAKIAADKLKGGEEKKPGNVKGKSDFDRDAKPEPVNPEYERPVGDDSEDTPKEDEKTKKINKATYDKVGNNIDSIAQTLPKIKN